ncbi:MAG: hypothetical protein OEV85_09915 [Candidatus Thorarchaeota archaeon]|nr:hypothetical protein [Candidatus Thorarchaeota archaeon]
MIFRRRAKKAKIQVYLRSGERPNTDWLRAASIMRGKDNKPMDPITRSMVGAFTLAAKTEIELSGGTGLHMSIFENTTLLIVQKAAEDLNCEYEFIDLRTGSLMDLDERGRLRTIGKKKLDNYEQNLPAPCLRVGEAVQPFRSEQGPTTDEIRHFYLSNSPQM